MADVFTESSRKDYYDMYLTRQKGTLLHRGQKRWWWRYTFVYNCFWGGTFDPVAETTDLGGNITALLNFYQETVRKRIALIEGDPRIRITMNETWVWIDEDEATNEPSMDEGKIVTGSGSDGEVLKASDPSYLQPVDSSLWNWQRYTGLALLLSVALSTMCLAQLSALRHRKRIRKQVWSNLASEEGVKDLLRSGWILKGSRMEIFDKSKLGYQDDSSILIGGFEQKEPVIGSEITWKVSREDSTKSPETRRHSSLDFLYPSSQTNLSSAPLQVEDDAASALDEETDGRNMSSRS